MGRAEINQDPTQEDFFNTENLGEFSDALVREAIQNSLDAGVPDVGEPVTVRIALPSAEQRPSPVEARPFFDHLFQHIAASEVVHDKPDPDDPVDFLVFEDFQTRGLVGDPTTSDDPGTGEDADFYYFWRNIGRAGKYGDQRGRWGLGKTMFPATSRLHSFFGLTVRSSDQKILLMGQSVLSIHHLEGEKRYPYGWFGEPDGADEFVLPIEDPEIVNRFSRLFQLTRTKEAGLSVVVPYPRSEIEHAKIVRSVISHYFFPILSSELRVEVAGSEGTTMISADTIDETCRNFGMTSVESFQNTLYLARKFLELDLSEIVEVGSQTANRSPIWSEDLFRSTDLERMAEVLDSGDFVAIRVPVHVIPVMGDSKRSFFDVVLERDSELDSPEDIFIRSGITISGVRSLRESGVRALVIVRDKALSTMLGDAENPAHTEWQERSRNFQGKYRVGRSTLQFVKESPRSFLQLMNKRSEHIDDTALRHIFPNHLAGKTDRRQDPSPGTTPDPTKSPRPKPQIQRRPQMIRVSQTDDGFRVRLTEQGSSELPCNVRIRAAYDVRRGNPFKQWAPADFTIETSDHQVTVEGGTLVEANGNRLRARAESADFYVSASNFDRQRDLVLDVRIERESNAEET